ncbi:minor capsid protein [Tissierella sp. MSJ-40]|uniref:Minor capsid protein n=1 Tax=Tissierella simiarum TaxID=2841534 RepID=A0ABS6ECP6_9FIRM|nr:minor capsid protein [Tissierella simiarum]MBU5440301.1 minor capsid protein [Tissierella simiarum]
MKNENYWKKRSEEIASKQFKKTDEYISSIVQEYEKAMSSIERDIESFYIRFSENNEITMAETRRLLKTKELKEFKWTVEEYIQKGKENAINQQWMKELENASTKVRVSRLEALQTQIQNQIEILTNSQRQGMKDLLSDVYQDTYYRNIYEVHKGLGIGTSFAKLDTQAIEKVLNQKWLGENFSSRVWNDKKKLIRELQTALEQSFIRGDSIDITASNLAKRMNVAKKRAVALINTESAYITNKSTMDSYKNSGVVKEYEILAVLDNSTSPICRSMDGKDFKVSEMKTAVNAPPFHTNCRTTTVAYFSDAEDEERIARDSEGRVYYVDGDVKYEQWYDKYVKSNPSELVAEKKVQNRYSDKEQYEKYKLIFGKDMGVKSFDEFQELKYNNSNEWENIKARKQEVLNSLDYKKSFFGKFGDKEVREWYIAHDKNIPNLIDKSKDIEEQAREAHSLRNKYRTEARNMMKDQKTRDKLDKESPNKSFDELIDYKMGKKNITREEAIQDIIKTATKTNKKVNKSLGLE